MPLSLIRASVQYRQELTLKQVNHTLVSPKLYAIQYIHLSSAHNNKTKYYNMELKSVRA